jgi:hypothetical protein
MGMHNAAGMAGESYRWQPGADLCNALVVVKIRSESGLCEVGDIIGANTRFAHGAQRLAFREEERSMSLRSWLFGTPNGHEKYDHVINLADELTEIVRERANRRDPFKAVLADLFFQGHDPALIADAYEMSQESRIYRGPEQ